jgi:ferritin-like metal-binding protein YciE
LISLKKAGALNGTPPSPSRPAPLKKQGQILCDEYIPRLPGRPDPAYLASLQALEVRGNVMKELGKLFENTLMDIYYAENQILKALPKMAQKAKSPELKKAFQTHLTQTEGQVKRLDQIFQILGKPPKPVKCEAITGILKECDEVVENFGDSTALDAGMIAAAQTVEHYEMARYGALRTWAEELGMKDAAKLLEETLLEERGTDQLLTKLAEAKVNLKAA